MTAYDEESSRKQSRRALSAASRKFRANCAKAKMNGDDMVHAAKCEHCADYIRERDAARAHFRRACERGWEICNLVVQPDHIYLFVRAWPADSAVEIIKECKCLSSHALRIKYPRLLKLPSLWTRSYFASTAENVSAETIRRYIEAQSKI